MAYLQKPHSGWCYNRKTIVL